MSDKPQLIQRGRGTFNATMAERMGPNYGVAKLSDEQVREIRQRYATGAVSMYALAEEYGVSRPAISYIVNRKRWRAVE